MAVQTFLALAVLASSGAAALGVAFGDTHAVGKTPLSVDASLETRRVLKGLYQKNDGLVYSPNRRRYLLLLARDDLQQNGTYLEFVTGLTDSLESAEAHVAATLFTSSAADLLTGLRPSFDAVRGLSGLSWLDDDHIVFGWSDGIEPTQVRSLNLKTREMRSITRHPMPVQEFSLSDDGRRILFKAVDSVTPERSERLAAMLSNGLSVGADLNIFHLLYGYYDGRAPWHDIKMFVGSTSDAITKPVECVAKNCQYVTEYSAPQQFSPDGRYAVVQLWPMLNRDPRWTRYTQPELRHVLESEAAQTHLAQFGLVDTRSGTLRELWNAPKRLATSTEPKLLWSADSARVLVGPTLMPADEADSDGLLGRAFAEIDVATGRFTKIPRPSESPQLRLKTWYQNGTFVMVDDVMEFQVRKRARQWHVVARQPIAEQRVIGPAVQLELRQGINSPPSLHAIDTQTGVEKLILDVEPRLRTDFTLARVEEVKWEASSSGEWHGRLFYPVGYIPGQRYPLVMNLDMEAAEGEFSIHGPSDGMGNCFASQALAQREIAVLNVRTRDLPGEVMASPDEPKLVTAIVEAAANHFVRTGLVDRDRIGLVGYSRTGWYVTHVISRSKWPFAAANTCDNHLGGYTDTAFAHGIPGAGGWGGHAALENGGEAFGAGLQKWLENAPGFNAERILTPLRIESATSAGVFGLLNYWELYSRLRFLNRPIELVLMTEPTKASHPLEMPAQKRFSKQATVDWMDFWLNDHEDTDPRKAEQYRRWRELRKQQQQVLSERLAEDASASTVAHQ